MTYKSKDLNNLQESLKTQIVIFQYYKKDGSIRTAKGTMMDDYLPEPIPDRIRFEVPAIDALMKEKNIPTIEDYAKENGLTFIGKVDIEGSPSTYVFGPIKKKKNVNEDLVSYYDVDKNEFRSFLKDNFLGIIS